MRKARAGLLVMALLATAVAAWLGTARPWQSTPKPSTPAELSTRLPLHGLLYTWTEDDRRIAMAQDRLTAQCMQKLGFRYAAGPLATEEQAATERPQPFGLETLGPPGEHAVPPQVQPEASQQPAYMRALYGDPDARIDAKGKRLGVTRPANGCQAEAERRMLGDERLRWLELRLALGDAEADAREALDRQPTYQALNKRWQECMSRAGLAPKDPAEVVDGLRPSTDLRTDPVARADVRCKTETDYLRVAYTLLGAAQRQWLDAHPDVLKGWQTLRALQDAAALQVMAHG